MNVLTTHLLKFRCNCSFNSIYFPHLSDGYRNVGYIPHSVNWLDNLQIHISKGIQFGII